MELEPDLSQMSLQFESFPSLQFSFANNSKGLQLLAQCKSCTQSGPH